MTSKIIVISTCETAEDAGRIARVLVEEGLAACVNVVAGVRSIYRWKGQVEEAGEVLLLIKTKGDMFEAVRDRILAIHPYETPEVVMVGIDGGSAGYLQWIEENCGL